MDRMEKLEEERYKTQVLLLEEKNKLKGKYNKLAEEHEKLVEEHKKMEEEHSKLKEKHNKLSCEQMLSVRFVLPPPLWVPWLPVQEVTWFVFLAIAQWSGKGWRTAPTAGSRWGTT